MGKYYNFSNDKPTGPDTSTKMVFDSLSSRITDKINEQIQTVNNGLLFTREPTTDQGEPQKTFLPFQEVLKGYEKSGKFPFYEFYKTNLEEGYDFAALDPALADSNYGSQLSTSVLDANVRNHLSLVPGECPVVNPNWQWGELDDVRSNPHSPLVGRVFLNDIMANYPIVIVEPGREVFNKNPISFLGIGSGSQANALNSYIRAGGEHNFGTVFKNLINLAVNVVLLPFTVIKGAINLVTGGEEMGKFIRFKNAMKLYDRMVNEVWRDVAGNLNLLGLELQNSSLLNQSKIELPSPDINQNEGSVTYNDQEIEEQYSKLLQSGQIRPEDYELKDSIVDYDEDSILPMHQHYDIEATREHQKNLGSLYRGTWESLNLQSILPNNALDVYVKRGGIIDTFMSGATKIYIPWLCTKGMSVSESFSNSTEDHPVASQMNALSQETKNEFGVLGTLIESAKDAKWDIGAMIDKTVSNVMKQLGGEVMATTAELGLLLNGKGQALFPQVWSSSSYSRSVSFNFKFFAPYGDTITIFENVLAQYLMWMVLAMPIQTAKNMYMSPFVIKAYSKGFFSCDFGMVESISVKRGEEKNDRNVVGLPRTISVEVSLKDLAPVMMMSVGGGTLWQFRAANTALSEYLSMLCGLTIADKTMMLNKMKKGLNKIFGKITEDFLNPHYWQRKASDSIFGAPFRWWAKSSGKITIERPVQYPGIGQ